jgi:hypothetical protein
MERIVAFRVVLVNHRARPTKSHGATQLRDASAGKEVERLQLRHNAKLLSRDATLTNGVTNFFLDIPGSISKGSIDVSIAYFQRRQDRGLDNACSRLGLKGA